MALAICPHHRTEITDANVIRNGQISLTLVRGGGEALLLQRAEIFGVADVLVVVAHAGKGEVGLREGHLLSPISTCLARRVGLIFRAAPKGSSKD